MCKPSMRGHGRYSSALYDTDSVYCIQAVPLDIMSAEI